MISDIVEYGTPEFKLMVKKAKKAGAYAKFGNDDYVAKNLVLSHQLKRQSRRLSYRSARQNTPTYSARYYRNITSVARTNHVASTIERGITNRQLRIDALSNRLETEEDPTQISKITRRVSKERADQNDAQARLQALDERRNVLQEEENQILQSLRETGTANRTTGRRRTR